MLLDIAKKEGKCWSKERAHEWVKARPLPMGMNYISAESVNMTEMFQKDSFNEVLIARELDEAAKYGYNNLRVELPFIVFEDDELGFLDRLDRFMQLGWERGMYTVPLLFDDCAFSNKQPYTGKQNAPTPFVHNSGWTGSPGSDTVRQLDRYEDLRHYVKTVVDRFKDDERIYMWDMYNEYGQDGLVSESVLLLLKSFEWARECNPTQPLTAAIWNCSDFDPEKEKFGFKIGEILAFELSDIISFHQYANVDKLFMMLDMLEPFGYPIVCTEWFARGDGFDSIPQTHLPIFFERRVGSFQWGLVKGKSQTWYPWGWNEEKGEPDVWFHNLLEADYTPYNSEETEVIKEYGRKIKVLHRGENEQYQE